MLCPHIPLSGTLQVRERGPLEGLHSHHPRL